MAKKDMKAALKSSLSVEEESVRNRFEKAETLFGGKQESVSAGKEIRQKEKVVRDSFTMPQADYELITALKTRSLNSGVQTTKSEILRAGLLALKQMNDGDFLNKLRIVEKIKTGRPKQTV